MHKPEVGIDQSGNAVFVWNQVNPATVQARARSAAGVLSATQTVSMAQSGMQPEVGIDQAGNAVFAWQRRDLSGYYRIQTRTRSAAGALGTIQTISDAGQNSSDGQLAVNRGGAAIATWLTSATVKAATGP
jgi:hypothetical protein